MHQITVSDFTIDVVRKDIKNLHLSVYPPDGRIRIAAPLKIDDEAVRLFAISKLRWIKKHEFNFNRQARQSPREYVSGESHYYNGRRYLLNVIEHDRTPKVVLRNNTAIDLYVREGSDTAKRRKVMTEWYRQELKAIIAPLVEKWQPIIGVTVNDWGVKQMKTRWGTYNIEARRIWVNLELAKKPPECLEYIIVHELSHLLERNHNDRFIAIMDRHMPQWRTRRDLLNAAPLGHESWTY